VRVSATLAEQTTYPFVRLEQAKRAAAARGVEIIDFGQGDPREPTDETIRRALADALAETMAYPKAEGLPELREAITAWCGRRFGVALDPASEVIPTYGSKEAIFSFAQVFVDRGGAKDIVVVPDPAYPVYERGAEFAGAEVVRAPLLEEGGFLPDVAALGDDILARTALVWVNYPNNPTAATAPLSFYRELAELAEEHDFLVCSDEAYTELWFDAPPASALELPDRSRVAVFNTLSKRSSMTGYRSGFVAGPTWLVDALRKYRPTVGTAPQEFVQRASIVAWNDEAHVERARETYRRKRDLLLPVLERHGWRVAGAAATMYLWVAVPGPWTSEEAAARLLEHGIVVAPGSYLGAAGEGYVRIALVPTIAECERAAAILEDAL
jgi:acetylornithine aminotransferase